MAGGSGSFDERSSDKSSSSKKSKKLRSAFLDEKRGNWRCRNCGWFYPMPNPDRRQRRGHKKHCAETLKVQQWLAVSQRRVPILHEKVESCDDLNVREASTSPTTRNTAPKRPLLQLDAYERVSKHSTRRHEIEHSSERGSEIEHESKGGTEIEQMSKRGSFPVIGKTRDWSVCSRTTSSVEGEKKIPTCTDRANLVGGKDEIQQVVGRASKGRGRHSQNSNSNNDPDTETGIEDVEDESILLREAPKLVNAKDEVLQVVGRSNGSKTTSADEGEKKIPTSSDGVILVGGKDESSQVVGRQSKSRGRYSPPHSSKDSGKETGIQDAKDEVLQVRGKLVRRLEGSRTTSAVEGEKKIPRSRGGAKLVEGKDESPHVIDNELKGRQRHSPYSHSDKDSGRDTGIQEKDNESIVPKEGVNVVKGKDEVLQVVNSSQSSRTTSVVEGETKIPPRKDGTNLIGGKDESQQVVVGRMSKGQGRYAPYSYFNQYSGTETGIQDVEDESIVQREGENLEKAKDEGLQVVVGTSEGRRTTFAVEGEKKISTRDRANLMGEKTESLQVVDKESKGRGLHSPDSHSNKDSGGDARIQDVEDEPIVQREGVNLVNAKDEVLHVVGRSEGSSNNSVVEGENKIPTCRDGASLVGGKDESPHVVGRESKGQGQHSLDSHSNKDRDMDIRIKDVEKSTTTSAVEGKWRCRNCGWFYPIPNPDRRQRREHKKHCAETLKVQQWLAVFRIRAPVVHGKYKSHWRSCVQLHNIVTN